MKKREQSGIRIGISGWRYVPWRGDFYPKGLVQRLELAFASRAVNTLEINGSFYGLQTPGRYANWYADTPNNFVFSVKAPRYITHIRRLREVEGAMANFFASGVFQLKEKLGPILWQFPPSFAFDEKSFGHFLQLLPHTGSQAKKCAADCDPRLQVEGYLDIPARHHLRHAVEIRHESFKCEAFIALLRKYQVALVVADSAGKWPYMEDVTSDFIYMRLHGDKELYRSGYTPDALKRWQKRIESWHQGDQPEDAALTAKAVAPAKAASKREIFCYFDNTDKLWAPRDARQLLNNLGYGDQIAEDLQQLAEELAV